MTPTVPKCSPTRPIRPPPPTRSPRSTPCRFWRRVGGPLRPYLRATYDHEFEHGEEASAWLQTLPEMGRYHVAGLDWDRDCATLIVGARGTLWGLDGNLGMTTTVARRSAREITLFVNLGGRF